MGITVAAAHGRRSLKNTILPSEGTLSKGITAIVFSVLILTFENSALEIKEVFSIIGFRVEESNFSPISVTLQSVSCVEHLNDNLSPLLRRDSESQNKFTLIESDTIGRYLKAVFK